MNAIVYAYTVQVRLKSRCFPIYLNGIIGVDIMHQHDVADIIIHENVKFYNTDDIDRLSITNLEIVCIL